MITQEYKLYITNPQYFNSEQNNFEKNLNGSIFIDEAPSPSGINEKTAIGKVYGIPVPFVNPQTNETVAENDGSMIINGEPSLFLPPKTLATEMLATIRTSFFSKYGVNIDFSIDPPQAATDSNVSTAPATTEQSNTTEQSTSNSSQSKSLSAMTPNAGTGTQQTILNPETGIIGKIPSKPTINSDAGKKVLIGAGILAAGVGIGLGINALVKKNKDSGTSGTPSVGTASNPSIDPAPEAGTAGTAIVQKKIPGIPILVPSQYLDVYVLSSYGGEKALVTTKESKQMIWTDKEYDRPEFLPSNLTAPLKENVDGTGDFGINIHLGYPGGKKVGYWSEKGDQVFSTKEELTEFFTYVDAHIKAIGNKITYTLCTRTDWDEAQKAVQTNQNAPQGTSGTSGTSGIAEKDAKEILQKVFENLLFDTNKADIKSSSLQSLDTLADLLKKETSWKLLIEGHTDSDGSDASNLDLSKRRAESAKKYLTDKGVAADMISTNGFGESKPIADNKTAEGKAKNRRVVFTITTPDKNTIVAGQKS